MFENRGLWNLSFMIFLKPHFNLVDLFISSYFLLGFTPIDAKY